jgi:hypothetical protein
MKNAQKSTLKQLRTEMLLMHSKAHAYIAKQLFGRLGLPKDYEKPLLQLLFSLTNGDDETLVANIITFSRTPCSDI